jgi:hypothetical protein
MCRKRKKRSGEKERRDGDEDLTGRWERIKDEREGVRAPTVGGFSLGWCFNPRLKGVL